MRAVRFHSFGGPLQVDEIDDPIAGADEVLVEISFVSVNPLDLWVRNGTVAGGIQPLPFITGVEASGHVAGRPVVVRGQGFGSARQGLAAERVAVRRDSVIDVPAGVDLAQAAGLGVAGVTALRAVHTLGQATADDRVVVFGASGGVGSMAVQLAVAAGATVWGQTSSAAKAAGVLAAGAHHVLQGDAATLFAPLAELAPTLVLDALGGGFTRAAVDALTPGGRLVTYGTSVDPVVTLDFRVLYRKGVRVLGYGGLLETTESSRQAMVELLDLVAAGKLSVPIDEVLPFDRAGEAHQRILDRQVKGKLLLGV